MFKFFNQGAFMEILRKSIKYLDDDLIYFTFVVGQCCGLAVRVFRPNRSLCTPIFIQKSCLCSTALFAQDTSVSCCILMWQHVYTVQDI